MGNQGRTDDPQTFVPSIFSAKPGDYRKAQSVQRIHHQPGRESYVELPLVVRSR